MNAERLLALYDQMADASDAALRLRRLVLDLAVRGRLAKQDPLDEPAAELLKRISEEKVRQIRAGQIKPRKLRSRPRKVPLTFIAPKGWELTDLGSIAFKITDGTHKTPAYVDNGVPFVSVKDFSAGRLDLSNTRFINSSEHHILYKRCDPRRGDILLGRIGTLGKAVLVETDAEFSLFVSVGLIRFDHTTVNPHFFQQILNSPFVESEFERIKIGGGTHTNKLNLGDLHTVAFPLPPLAEQHRIVAKVHELTTLCNQLEKTRRERENTRNCLVKSSFSRLTAANTNDETFRAHAGFAVGVFPTLTARADQVKHLRETILDLAVRGKLVDQDPADESASLLLKRIKAEKARLMKEGRLRKRSNLPTVENPPFLVPQNWSWTRMRDVTSDRGQRVPDAAFTYIDVTAINKESGLVAGSKVLGASEAPSRARKIVQPGDVIYSCVRPYLLNVAVIEDDFDPVPIASTAFAVLNGHGFVLPRYIWIVLRSPFMVVCVEQSQRGQSYPAINDADFAVLPFPLPPLAEQQRIVAKVKQLMVLCNQLESNLRAVDDCRQRLIESLLQDVLLPKGANTHSAESPIAIA